VVDETIANGGGKIDDAAPNGVRGERPSSTLVGGHEPQRQNIGAAAADGRSAIVDISDLTSSGYGVIKLQDALAQAHIAALSAPANDNATTDRGGARDAGFKLAIFGLTGGDALLTWVGPDGHAHGRLCAPVDSEAGGHRLDPPEYAAVNAALGDLGPVAPMLDGARRIQVTEPRPGTFAIMWLALAESGFAARGKMFVAAPQGGPHGMGDALWTEHTIEKVSLPGFAGGFQVAGGAEGDQLVVSYGTANGSQSIVLSAARHGETTPGENDHVQLTAEATHHLAAATIADAGDVANGPGGEASISLLADTPQLQTNQKHLVSAPLQAPLSFKIAAEVGTNESTPIVMALGHGFAVAWLTPGSSDGVSLIKLTLYDEHGVAKTLADGSTVLLVSDSAATDAPPAISDFGDGLAVAYKRSGDGDLVVKFYSATGSQIGKETVVDAGETGAILEIATASTRLEAEGSDAHDQLAVVYTVAGHDAGGVGHYGNIMLQRLGIVTDAGSAQIVMLGRDGDQDENDLPAALMMEHYDGEPDAVVGRAPAVAGLDDGEFAIVWVENDGTRETIRGGVLEVDGAQVLRIDLTRLIENGGIVKGTKPTLLDAGDGNFLVSWLQHDGDDGGFVAMAAHYEFAAQGVWIEPEHSVRLKAFDSEPDDYSVTLSQADELAVIVTWEEDSSGPGSRDQILSQRFDISGGNLDGPVQVANRSALEQQGSTDSLAAAGLADGQIVVVYAEQGSHGDTDLAAHIIDVGDADDRASSTTESPETAAPAGVQLSDAADDAKFSTSIDQEIAINILGSDADVSQSVTRVNGVPIDAATPIDVGSAWVQLREDGWLTVSPDEGYAGTITFECTVASPTGSETTSGVTVSVENAEAREPGPIFNQMTALAENVPSYVDGGAGGTIAADEDLDTGGLFVVGLDAGMFTIIGSTLHLKAGIEFDFKTEPWAGDELLATARRDAAAHYADADDGALDPANSDTLVFSAYGLDQDNDNDAVELPSSAYAAFRQLVEAGALTQVGDDVVITLGHDDPANPNTVTLKGVALSDLTDPAFKF
jgi:hypothetical protein